jgi:hypothetical protein
MAYSYSLSDTSHYTRFRLENAASLLSNKKLYLFRDHQEMRAYYADLLCGLSGPHQTVVGEQVQQASKCLRKI